MKILNSKGFTLIEIVLVIVVLAIIGLVGWRFISNSQKSSNQTQTVSSQDILPDNLSDIKPIEDIMTIAKPEIGERKVIQVELNQEGSKLVYEISLGDNNALVYDAKTGEKLTLNVKDAENEKDDDGDDLLPAGFVPSVNLQDVLSKAKAEHPGVEVRKIELEVEDGVVVFSARFVDKYRVDIDAKNGTVLRVKSPKSRDIKLKDNDDDIDDDSIKNSEDDDNDNSGGDNSRDDDDEGDGVRDDEDEDDDNDGEDDASKNEDDESENEDNSNSGSNRD